MKTTNEVLAETGLSYPMLNRLKDLGLIPKPVRKGLGNRKGVIGVFDDEIVDIINWVRLHQQRGLSLSRIAELRRTELAEIEAIKPKEEYLIALKADATQSFLDAYDGLYPWLEKQIEQQRPGYELAGVEMQRVTRQGDEFLKPKRIEVRPKAKNKK